MKGDLCNELREMRVFIFYHLAIIQKHSLRIEEVWSGNSEDQGEISRKLKEALGSFCMWKNS